MAASPQLRRLDTPLSDLFSVVEERYGAAFRKAPAVVGEFHADLVCALPDGRIGLGGELPEPEQVVDVASPALA